MTQSTEGCDVLEEAQAPTKLHSATKWHIVTFVNLLVVLSITCTTILLLRGRIQVQHQQLQQMSQHLSEAQLRIKEAQASSKLFTFAELKAQYSDRFHQFIEVMRRPYNEKEGDDVVLVAFSLTEPHSKHYFLVRGVPVGTFVKQ